MNPLDSWKADACFVKVYFDEHGRALPVLHNSLTNDHVARAMGAIVGYMAADTRMQHPGRDYSDADIITHMSALIAQSALVHCDSIIVGGTVPVPMDEIRTPRRWWEFWK